MCTGSWPRTRRPNLSATVSKAFVNEDAPTPEVNARIARRTAGERRYITPEGHARLVASIETLRAQLSSLPPSTDAAAKADLEAQLSVHLDTLEQVQIVTLSASEDRVFFGAWVELEDEDGARVTWRLVGPDEADVRAGLISVDSPVGRALLGKEVGDEVKVQRPKGTCAYSILAVRYHR